jgi:hypothetical protein
MAVNARLCCWAMTFRPCGANSAPRASQVVPTLEFHALCEGLAALDIRSVIPAGQQEQIWRSALTALITGFASTQADEPAQKGQTCAISL